MTDYTTIRVTVVAKNAAEESKREDETWNEYIQRCTENPPTPREFVDVDALVDELGTVAGGPQVDDSEMARAVVRQFDYAELANAVADEVEARLR